MAKSCAASTRTSINHSWFISDLSRSVVTSLSVDPLSFDLDPSVPVVVGFEGARLVEAHVLGLVVGELGEVRLEGGEVQGGDELVHQLGHQVDVGLVPAGGRVEQLCETCGAYFPSTLLLLDYIWQVVTLIDAVAYQATT